MPYGSAAIDTIESSGNLAITGNVTATGTLTLGSQALGAATAGEFEYDGRVPYFTPLGTQRGVVPGQQFFSLASTLAGSNATGSQNVFGVGVTLSSSTQYYFESSFVLIKTAGTTNHSINFGFGGTATLNFINYSFIASWQSGTWGTFNNYGTNSAYGGVVNNTTTLTAVTTATTTAGVIFSPIVKGTLSVNAGGTFIPQYSLSAAPGGAYSTQPGSYFLIYPIGAAGSNVSVGTWA